MKKLLPNKVTNFYKKVFNYILKIITLFSIKAYSIKNKPLVIREDTTDNLVFRSIFILRELKLPIKIKPKVIVDGGAYVGISTLYYSQKYPTAKIIAIEPEASNFELLKKNTKYLSNVICINAGLWYKNTFLKVIDRHTGKWGFVVKEVSEFDDFDVESITIDQILEKFAFNKIDILKLDIEGSEKYLFSLNYKSWIDKVNIMVIELHDRITPGCTEALYSAINRNEWREYKNGEKVILIRDYRGQ